MCSGQLKNEQVVLRAINFLQIRPQRALTQAYPHWNVTKVAVSVDIPSHEHGPHRKHSLTATQHFHYLAAGGWPCHQNKSKFTWSEGNSTRKVLAVEEWIQF